MFIPRASCLSPSFGHHAVIYNQMEVILTDVPIRWHQVLLKADEIYDGGSECEPSQEHARLKTSVA